MRISGWSSDVCSSDLALYFVQKRVTRRAFIPLQAIPIAWWFHGETLARHRPQRLIEFGAGKNLGQNLYLARPGLRQQVVDLHPMLDLTLVNHVIAVLNERHGLRLAAVASLEDLQSRYRIA